MNLFITGIGTGVGKTLVSAILCEAFGADYWKPIQSGNLEDSDADYVRQFITNPKSVIHPESYRFELPASPHAAAAAEKKSIDTAKLKLPRTANHLIIEGAGGVLVPLNSKSVYADWVAKQKLPAVLVSRHYLGSINHTLLSIEALRLRGINILGIVFNGDENKSTEQVILQMSKLPVLGRVRQEKRITTKVIAAYAEEFRKSFKI